MRATTIAAALLLAFTAAAVADEGDDAPGYPRETPQAWTAPAPQPVYVAPAPSVARALAPMHVEERPRYGLLAAGVAVFGGLYLVNAMVAYAAGDGRLAVPVIGPLLVANWKSDAGSRFGNMLAIFDAAAQATGVVLFAVGALTKKSVTVYEKVAIAPTVLPSGAGLAALGRF